MIDNLYINIYLKMAPKLADVKSESWLDLSKEPKIKRPKWLLRRAQTQVPESSSSSSSVSSDSCSPVTSDSSDVTWPKSNHIQSIKSSNSQYDTNNKSNNDIKPRKEQEICDTKIHHQESSQILNQAHSSSIATTTGSTCSLHTSSQDHLLIRIRQESFRLSRRRSSLSDMQNQTSDLITNQTTTTTTRTTTTTTTTTTKTSALHENQSEHSLQDPSQLLNEDISNDTINGDNKNDLNDLMILNEPLVGVPSEESKDVQTRQHIVSGSSSSRLQRFKRRLEQRSRRSSSLLRIEQTNDDIGSNQFEEKEDKSLFSQRSFSSLGDKFGHHLRQSWRKFLTTSSQSINNNNETKVNKHKQQNEFKLRDNWINPIINYKETNDKKQTYDDINSLKSDYHQTKCFLMPEDATDPINKLKLTERWLENHHQLERLV